VTPTSHSLRGALFSAQPVNNVSGNDNQVRESERIKQPKHPNLVRAAAPAGRARAERIRFEDTLQPAARPEKLLNLLTIRHGGDQMVTARRPERILVRAGSERPASRPRVADCSRCA